jgi:hypothetical protein
LQTAQLESDPHRQGQYARAAADTAAEVAMNDGASAEDRERALAIMRSSLTLIPGSLLGEAQSMLTAARGEADPSGAESWLGLHFRMRGRRCVIVR